MDLAALRARLLSLAASRGLTLTAARIEQICAAAFALADDPAKEAHLQAAIAAEPAPTPAPAAGEDPISLRAERDRLRAEAAARDARDQRTGLETRLAAARTADGRQIPPAHISDLVNRAMAISDAATREAMVAGLLQTLSTGLVAAGERGATGVHVGGGDGISDGLHTAAVHHRVPIEFVLMAQARAEGGIIRLADARAAAAGMRMRTAAAEIPSLAYQETMTLIRSMYLMGWETAPTFVDRFANVITDDAETISYNALGSPPRMRQWTDEIQGRMMNTLPAYTVTIEDWEATLEIPLGSLRADRLGQYALKLQQMGAYARRHPDRLLLDMIANAQTIVGYDGHPLCDNDHAEGDSGAQDNLLACAGDDTLAHIITDLNLGIAAQQGFKDDRGEVLDIGWEPDAVYDVICRAGARSLFNDLASLDTISGSSNGWKGRLRVQSSGRLTTANRWWFCYLGSPVRPGIVQYQTGGQPSDPKELGPDSEHCKKTGHIWVSVQGRYTVKPGDWRPIIEFG